MGQNPNDEIREAILKLLHSIHQHPRGMSSTAISISKIRSELKKQGFKSSDIISNLDYLIQSDWVIQQIDQYTFTKGGSQFTGKKITYKIADKGINHFQGVSKFQNTHSFKDVNIFNNKGVTIIGNNNIVYNQHTDLFKHLDLLDTEFQKTDQFSPEEKLNYHSDIETIKSQLSKPKPNKQILEIAWKGVKAAATAGGFITLCQKIATLIGPLI